MDEEEKKLEAIRLKNRQAAKASRQKKKDYIKALEMALETLQAKVTFLELALAIRTSQHQTT
jgi:hypothetical protein